VALSADGRYLAAVTEGGRLSLSADEGAHFEPAALPEGVAAADVVLATGTVWVRTRTGSLLAAKYGRVLERCAVPGAVAALAADGAGGVLALAADESGRPATLVRGGVGDGAITCEAVEPPGGRAASLLAGGRELVAYVTAATRSGVVLRGSDGTWVRFAWEGRVRALALAASAGALVAAVYSEGDDTTGLVAVDAAGRASLVGRVGAARDDVDADGRAVALASDDPKGVMWVAGGFGVAAFATK
jgi:hypothetical protein